MSWRHRHRARIVSDEIPLAEYEPNFSLDQKIAEARRDMGEDRWTQLNREWEQKS